MTLSSLLITLTCTLLSHLKIKTHNLIICMQVREEIKGWIYVTLKET